MRRFIRLMSAALAAALLIPAVALAVPATVPVQGVLQDADGAPIAGDLPVEFNLYADAAGEALVWTETRQVSFDRGFFTLDLGADEPLDAGLFRDNAAGLWLGIAVDGDDEMALVAIGTAPFAGFAEYAGEAATAANAETAATAATADRATVADSADDAALLGGVAVDDLARADHTHPFAALTDIPAGLADGDDDTTYAAGDGLTLADGSFALRPCAAGEVLVGSDAGWVCAAGETLSPAVGAELVGTDLVITDGVGVSVVDLAALVADGDADPANELLIGAALEDATLVLTDAGGETRVDLGALIPDAALAVTAAALEDTTLTLSRGADPADALAVDLAPLVPVDGDSDPTNELLQGGALNGTVLTFSDAGGDVSVDLAALTPEELDGDPLNEVLQAAMLAGADLVLTDAGGQYTVDLSSLIDDADADAANELIRAAAFDGAVLTISDAGGDYAIDLSGLGDDADPDPTNELLTGASFNGGVLTLADAGGQRQVDLSALVDDADPDPTNELLTGASLNGSVLTLADNGGQRQVELGSLIDDADADPANELLTGASLNGTTLSIEDAGGQRQIELASLIDDADADPTNERITGVSLDGTVLRIEEGGAAQQVDLAGVASDDQTLSIDGASGALTISEGNTVNVWQGAFVLSSNLGISEDDIAFADSVNGDDNGASVELPFTVNYGGVAYTHAFVSTNGWIEFQQAAADLNADFSNETLPTNEHPGPFAAIYWDDLVSTVSWEIAGTAPNRVFTVYWTGDTFTGDHIVRFTAQISETSGAITARYLSMAPEATGQGATLGFQTAGGANAKAYPLSTNVKVLDDNTDDNGPSEQGWSIAPLR